MRLSCIPTKHGSMEAYKYKEWTLRKTHRRYHEHPQEGLLISEHESLADAKKVMTAETYIYNEQYEFTILPSHCGLTSAIEDPNEIPQPFIDDDDEEVCE
jgi:hypothetical protein